MIFFKKSISFCFFKVNTIFLNFKKLSPNYLKKKNLAKSLNTVQQHNTHTHTLKLNNNTHTH